MAADSDDGEQQSLFGALFDDGEAASPPAHGSPWIVVDFEGRPIRVPHFMAQEHMAMAVRAADEWERQEAEEREEREDSSFVHFPVPLLRRNLSLSKNTAHSLHHRLFELRAEQSRIEAGHKRTMLELEEMMKMQTIRYEERVKRMEQEVHAVEQAIDKIQRQQEEKKKEENEKENEKVACCDKSQPNCCNGAQGDTSPLNIPRAAGCDANGDESGCGVCLEADRDTLIAPCGHVALCFDCSNAIWKSKNPECPYCRSKITGVYKLFVV